MYVRMDMHGCCVFDMLQVFNFTVGVFSYTQQSLTVINGGPDIGHGNPLDCNAAAQCVPSPSPSTLSPPPSPVASSPPSLTSTPPPSSEYASVQVAEQELTSGSASLGVDLPPVRDVATLDCAEHVSDGFADVRLPVKPMVSSQSEKLIFVS